MKTSRSINENTLLVSLLFIFSFFQILTIKVGTTSVDVSYIFLFLILIKVITNIKTISKLSILFFLITSLSTLYSIKMGIPIKRIFSVWIFLVFPVFIWLQTEKIILRISIVNNVIYILLFLQSFLIIIQYIYGISRPAGTFSEPSPAGLVLYSGIIFVFFHARKSFTFGKILLIFMLLISAFLTRSMHFVTMLLLILLILFILGKFRYYFWGLLFLVIFVNTLAFLPTDILDRFYLDSESGNLSVLVWLRSLDSFFYVLHNSIFLGFGPGSSGFIEYPSAYNDQLYGFGAEKLNKFDLYSGFFRLAFELGLIITFILICKFYLILRNSLNFYDKHITSINIFAMMIFLGVLVKEPVWSKSLIGIFIIGTMLNDYNNKNVTTSSNSL